MTIKEIQEEIIDEFDLFEDWMERYEHLIDLGKSLPIIEERFKMDENLIKGCQSKVWLHAEIEKDQ
jgi:cysteine desulfuration protein SufE